MRLWLDTTTAAIMANKNPEDKGKALLQKLIDDGHTIVIANTAIDVAAFQKDPDWLEKQLENKTIIVEIWHTPDQMTSKPFYWSSRGEETNAADNFEAAIETLADNESILDVKELVEIYGIPKGEWPCGEYNAPAPLSEEVAAKMGIPVDSTRTTVLRVALEKDMSEEYDEYNSAYCANLAKQHFADAVITTDGGYKEV